MNFERRKTQLLCESIIGCNDPSKISDYKTQFESITIDATNETDFNKSIQEESKDYYYKGLISLCEGINGISRGLYSWATVKLYYSVYYFLRASMASQGYSILRLNSLYILKIKKGESPQRKNGRNYNSDHKGTILHYIDLFEHDLLQSNNIDNQNSYEWLMDRREQVHYRERYFNEPGNPNFWDTIANYVSTHKLSYLLELYIKDTSMVYCFQPEHAILALPLKRAILTRDELKKESIDISLTKEKEVFLRNLLMVDGNILIDPREILP